MKSPLQDQYTLQVMHRLYIHKIITVNKLIEIHLIVKKGINDMNYWKCHQIFFIFKFNLPKNSQ